MKNHHLFFILFTLFLLILIGCNTADNPVPILSSITPSEKVTHMPSFTLTATGTDFVDCSRIFFNNQEKATTFINSTELTCEIRPNDILSYTTIGVNVWVENPEPGGGISQSLQFTIKPNHSFYNHVNVSNTNGESSQPSIAVDEKDVLHVSWLDNTAGWNEIYYSRSENHGASWSLPANISQPAISTWAPAIAAGQGENIYIVWIDVLGTAKVVLSRSDDGGVSWNSPVGINGSTGSCYAPHIEVVGDDDLYVAWYELVSKDIIFSRSSDGGSSWSVPVDISNTPGYSDDPSIAVDGTRNIYVVWSDTTPGKT
jgi:hypothetical protein